MADQSERSPGQPSRDPADRHLASRGPIRMLLLATDLSPVSEAATGYAVDLAARLGARLLVVNVIDPARRAPGYRSPRVDQLRTDREAALLEIVGAARSRGVEAAFLVWTGEAGKSIVAAVDAEGADMVVVGTRAMDKAGRFLLGSVSDYVVYHAACPVLVAR